MNQTKAKKLCLVFPGYGSQYVGMAKDLFDNYPYINSFIKQCDELLGFKLSDIMFYEDLKTLSQVEYGGVALYLHSMSLWKILQNEYEIENVFDNDKYDVTIMGHSIGEYAAFHNAGLFKSLQDGLFITNKYMQSMQKCTTSEHGMCALVTDGKDIETNVINNLNTFITICEKYHVDVANINTPNQLVVTGYKKDIKDAIKELNDERMYNKKLRHKFLDVCGTACHSRLLKPSETELFDAWKNMDLNDNNLKCEIFMSATGRKYEKGIDNIPQLMSKQLYDRVYFNDCIRNYMDEHRTDDETDEFHFVEIGPKSVLSKMIQQICEYYNYSNVTTINIDTSNSIKLFESVLN